MAHAVGDRLDELGDLLLDLAEFRLPRVAM
jgi:hypothetical protein